MASISTSFGQQCMEAFRAALTPGTGDALTADRLCEVGYCLHLTKGEALPPDPFEDRLVFLAEGSAKLAAQPGSGAGSGQVLAFHFGGDVISLLRQSDGDFRLVALADCDLVVFPADCFLDIAQNDPPVLRAVLTRSLQALHRSRTRMMQMGHKSAAARISDFLVSMAERLAHCSAGPCAFSLPMSRRDIGDSLGLTIETVSRQLTELREAGLIATEGRSRVCLSDVSALVRVAGRPAERSTPAKKLNAFDLDQQLQCRGPLTSGWTEGIIQHGSHRKTAGGLGACPARSHCRYCADAGQRICHPHGDSGARRGDPDHRHGDQL